MAGVMVATFIVAVRWLPRGRLESVEDEEEEFVAGRGRAWDGVPMSDDQLVTKLSSLSVAETVARFSEVLGGEGRKPVRGDRSQR